MAIEKSKLLIYKAFENSIYLPDIKIVLLRKLLKFTLIKFFYFIRSFRYISLLYIGHPILIFIYSLTKNKIEFLKNRLELKKKFLQLFKRLSK